ncbi:hypothetical protein GCM10017708_14320 [Arthrobacter citreus]
MRPSFIKMPVLQARLYLQASTRKPPAPIPCDFRGTLLDAFGCPPDVIRYDEKVATGVRWATTRERPSMTDHGSHAWAGGQATICLFTRTLCCFRVRECAGR